MSLWLEIHHSQCYLDAVCSRFPWQAGAVGYSPSGRQRRRDRGQILPIS
jgi:hypothetical protein